METLYGSKRKKTNRWLKLLLLLFVAVGFGIPNLNAQTNAIKVANNQQLLQVMENPAVQSYVVEGGYYNALKRYVKSGTTFFKKADGNGNRDTDCQYFIEPNDYCFDTTPGNWVYGIAVAGTDDPNVCLCCPPDSTGQWTVISKPTGSTLQFIGLLSAYTIDFRVDMPGIYVLLYQWPYPYNTTGVFGSYPFYGPYDIVLEAPDVCAGDSLSTLVHFEYTTVFSNQGTTLTWTLDGEPYDGPQISFFPPNDTTFIVDFILEVDYCGLHELSVIANPVICNSVGDTIYIDFSCQPIADAGEDAYVCFDNCYSLHGSTGLYYTWSTNYLYTWVQISGPEDVTFGDVNDTTTDVCRPDRNDPDDVCPYGIYEIALDVVNGECEDNDTMLLTFYEQPTANAGPDISYCADTCFSLAAVPYVYCGIDGVNYWSHAWWELVSSPVGTVVTFDTLDPSVNVCVSEGEPCAYGTYVFVWNELNVKVVNINGRPDTLWSVSHCFASDTVSITIFEQPVADAGDDYWACVDLANSPFCYSMTGTMEYCYTMQGVWTKSCAPGEVVFDSIGDPASEICFTEPGRYIFIWTAWNDECQDSDTVLFDLLEEPTAFAEDDTLMADCDFTCIDLGVGENGSGWTGAGIIKYDYFGVDGVENTDDDCPNYWDMAHWSYVDGPLAGFLDPTSVVFGDDTDPATELCVSYYGAYTVSWVELNQPPDKDYYCSDTVLVFVEFFETPAPDAGDDSTICGNCYTLMGIVDNYEPYPNQHGDDHFYWTALTGNPCVVDWADSLLATTQVCIPDDPIGACYGEYGFVLHQSNGDCFGTDTVYITFDKIPDDVSLCFINEPNYCGPWDGLDIVHEGCLQPNEVLYVCAEGCTYFDLCDLCDPGFDWGDDAFWGYTFEWSLISPAGTIVESEPGWYDFENGHWNIPYIDICWGECCDTARLYLTITNSDGYCVNTMEYKFYVNHKPCVDIVGPEVSEVGDTVTYCNVCPPEFDTDCLLYTWTAEHCGIITEGQGTECIDVLWTDYNINGGWGEITLTVFDTCTGCCNYDEMLVKVWPTGTLGDDTLSGHVYYHNDAETPLNGVEIQLWNSGIPVQVDTSFNDIEGGNGMGYYEFPGINGTTNFGITASYDAPWYGANATDGLAVELKVINALPGGFLYDVLVGEAMDVNNTNTISATDALWIKQRAINMVNYFPAGDWVFNPGMISSAGTLDIYTLNAGDANRSNIPASMKETPAIALVTDGTMNVVTGQEFELPIRIADANQFSAITLYLGYNSALIEVVDVTSIEGMLDNISNGNVSIAWSSVNPMVLAANDVVVTLKVKAISPFTATESLFSIGLGSEFADASASVIEPVTLKTFGITTEPAAEDYFLSANRPNPFSNSTFIEYTMPETGKVKLSVLDMLGQEIAVIVNATQTAGSYTIEFSAAGLATGVYIYKITVDGETRDFISTQRMVISH